MRINTKLALIIASTIICVIMLSAWFMQRTLESSFREALTKQQMAFATRVADELDLNIRRRIKLVENVARDISGLRERGKLDISTVFANRPAIQGEFPLGLYLLDRQGKVLARHGASPSLEREPALGEVVARTLESGQSRHSAPHASPLPGEQPRMIFTSPVRDAAGAIVGVLAAATNPAEKGFLGFVADIRIGESGYAYVFSRDRLMLMHPDPSRFLQRDIPPGSNALLDRAIAGFEGAGEAVNSRGVPMFAAFKQLRHTDWVLALTLPLAEAYQPLHVLQKSIWVILILGLIFSVFISWFLTARVTAPLVSLTGQIRRLSETPDSFTPVSSGGKGEIGQLATAFNKLIARVGNETRQRALAEDALRQSEDKLRRLLELTCDWVWELDENGRYTYASERVSDILGYEAREIIGRTPFDLMPPGEAERVRMLFGEIMQAQRPFAFLRNVNLNRQGQEVILETSGTPIFDDGGKFRGYRGIDRNISDRERTLTRLQESEQLFRTLSNLAPVGIFQTDARGGCLYVNERWCQITGMSAPDSAGMDWLRTIHPDDRGFMELEWENAVRSGRRFQLDCRLLTPAGQLRWITCSAIALRDEGGQLTGQIGTMLDITERQRAQEALRRSEAQYRTLVENIDLGIVMVDASLHVVTANQATLANVPDARIEPGSRWNNCPGVEAMETGEPAETEFQTLDADDRPRWTKHRALPFQDSHGTIAGFIEVIENITERKQFEQVLLEGEERFRSIAESASDAVIVANRRGDIVYWNSGAEKTFGFNAHEALGRPLTLIIPERFRSRHLAGMKQAATRQNPVRTRVEVMALRRDGQELPVDISLGSWTASDGIYFSSIIRDITERKRFEQELMAARDAASASARAKSEFLANMSHEIRTPMNGILGMAELALGTDLTQEQREYLELVHRSAESLLTIINDVLDFTKIDAEKLELEHILFEPRALLEEIIRMQALRAARKGLRLDLDIDRQVPMRLQGDPVRLRQIIINLVHNAIKFTAAGSIRLMANIASEDGNNCQLHFAVSDTGIGIPADKHEMIFNAFTQADSSINRQFGGTGLGLSICRKLVHLMGGRIYVESQEGRGSTFHFTASFSRPAMPPAGGAADAAVDTSHPLRRLEVLLAEDNPVNRKFAGSVLEKAGHRVTVAVNGQEAVEQGEQRCFDAILMDIQMPAMDGFAATRLLRSKGVTTPIIALTAHAVQGFREQCLDAGIDDYLSKPVQGAILLRKLDQLARRSENQATPAPVLNAPPSPTLDLDAARKTAGGDMELLGTMASMIIRQIGEDLPVIRRLAESRDGPGLGDAAHRLKGSLATVGAMAAHQACHALEILAKESRIESFDEGLRQLERKLNLALGELQKIRA